MAKHEREKDAAPPQWLQKYMGRKWRPWTLARWYDALVSEGMIQGRVPQSVDGPASNPGS